MKKLLVVLVLLVSGLGYSQSHNDTLEKWYNENRLAVEREFVRLIDSARSNITIEKHFAFRSSDGLSQKDIKSIVKEEESNGNFCQVVKFSGKQKINFVIVTKKVPVVKIQYDSILSLASNHHAQYLVEVGESDVLSHQEYKNYYGFEYDGDLPILENPTDRVKFYCPNRTMYLGECAAMFIIGHIATFKETAALNYCVKNINHVNVKSVAMLFFKGFKNSKPHWNAYMSKGDIDYMGVSFIMDFKSGDVRFVTVMGNDKNDINTGIFDNE
jgi:hypothetical protein